MSAHSLFAALVLVLTALAGSAQAAAPPGLAFEENRGQLPDRARYAVRGEDHALLVTPDGAELQLEARDGTRHRITLRFGETPREPVAEAPLAGRLHDFRGSDPKGWHTDIRRFARVRYPEVQPGVDAVLHDRDGRVEFDFEVAPGADPNGAVVSVDGADAVDVDAEGRLVLRAGETRYEISAPLLFQEGARGRDIVPGAYRRVGPRRFAFEVGAYDRERPLVIDPVLLGYSTRLGGSDADFVEDVAIDAAGNLYLAGSTRSSDFLGAPLAAVGDDVFVAKIAPNGMDLVYVAILSGSGTDQPWGLDVDAAGNAYVAGQTDSANFPTPNGYDTTVAMTDAFLAQLDPNGVLLYGTFYGAADLDGEFDGGVAVHSSGRVYIGGRADSTNLPLINPFSSNCPAGPCAFVAGFDPSLSGASSLVYATYVTGGNVSAEDNGILDLDIDASENLYTFGFVNPDATVVLPGQGFLDTTMDMVGNDHFVVKLDPSLSGASQRIYSTVIGGNDDEDERGGIHATDAGILYVASRTFSGAAFPVKNAIQASNAGDSDIYVQKIDTTLVGAASQIWGTFLGGSAQDEAHGVTVDSSGNVWITASVASPGFGTVLPLPGSPGFSVANSDAVLELSSDGQTLRFASVVPAARRLVADASDRIHVAGSRSDAMFALNGGLAPSPIGLREIAVFRLDPLADRGLVLEVDDTVDPAATGDTFAYRYLVQNLGDVTATDITLTTDFPGGLSLVNTSANCTFPGVSSDCELFEPLAVGENQPIYLQASSAGVGSFPVNASTASALVDPTPGDNSDSETLTITLGGSAPATLELSDFDAVARTWDIGGFALDTAEGVLGTPNGSEQDAINLMVFDGSIDLRVAEILGQGEVAFGFVERSSWTPSDGDGEDLFGRDFNASAHRVFVIVDHTGRVELRTAKPFSPGRVVATGYADLGRQQTFTLLIDKVTPNAQVLYEGFVIAEGNPFTVDPSDANPANVGDDQVVSIGFGTESRGAATVALPEPGTPVLFASGALLLFGLVRRRARA